MIPGAVQVSGCFRGLIASASLKHDHVGHPLSFILPFPRLDCLGLIEALRKGTTRGRESRFRGLIASASLKLDAGRFVEDEEGGFPRLDCLGLIEAGIRHRECARSSPQFPRLDCLGLIEAHFRRGGHLAPLSFRGLIASASLKHASALAMAFSPALFPRLDCLGLIEASDHCSAACTSSPRFPRLDCLGLIEAMGPAPIAPATKFSFRGLIASASLKRVEPQ